MIARLKTLSVVLMGAAVLFAYPLPWVVAAETTADEKAKETAVEEKAAVQEPAVGEAEKEKANKEVPVVQDGKTVKVHYTLTVDGKNVDSSRQGDPLDVKVGEGNVIPGFENALKGMKTGEKKSFDVSPAEGYGQVDPQNMVEVPTSQLPADLKPEVGMTLYATGEHGQPIPARIAEVKESSVIMNFNHPLAGKTLHFDVEVIDIKQ